MTHADPLIGLMITDRLLRDQIARFLRFGGFRVVGLDDPHCSNCMLGQFNMLIVSRDVGEKYQANLMRLKLDGPSLPILVVCGRDSAEALRWTEAGFDDALPFPMIQPTICGMVGAYLRPEVSAG